MIFGDDIGRSNISAYTHGLMGYKTPNIDRIAKEGMMFTDYYAENSCTAGRSTFITGQVCLRTGLCKVGIPGAPVGLQDRDMTIAQALKPLGYATGQFGKNHLGDRDEYLPTKHGFDEFFGNLYHLNAEEEPERPYYPKNDAAFVKSNSPRGVLKASADGKIEDTGPLNRKRMETVDDETTAAAIDFMQRQVRANKPFFTWMNTTRMHAFTHVRESMRGQSGMPGNEYADGMIEHDGDVGKLLKAIDDLGIANNTIVVYSTDNGPNQWSWPDAATTPFRSEKDTNWEGAFRVPAMVRWPGRIKAGEVSNEMISGLDWFPTLLAAAGDADVKDRLVKGTNLGGKSFKVHLDGYNQLPYLTGQAAEIARATSSTTSMTTAKWSLSLQRLEDRVLRAAPAGGIRGLGQSVHLPARAEGVQPAHGSRSNAPTSCRISITTGSPRTPTSCNTASWRVAPFLQTFKEYPPSQRLGELQHRPDGRRADEEPGQDGRQNSGKRMLCGLEKPQGNAVNRPPPLAAGWILKARQMNDLATTDR